MYTCIVYFDDDDYSFSVEDLKNLKSIVKNHLESVYDSTITIVSLSQTYSFEEITHMYYDLVYIRWDDDGNGIVHYPDKKESVLVYTVQNLVKKLVHTYKQGKTNEKIYKYVVKDKIKTLSLNFDMKDYVKKGKISYTDVHRDLTTDIKLQVHFPNIVDLYLKGYQTLKDVQNVFKTNGGKAKLTIKNFLSSAGKKLNRNTKIKNVGKVIHTVYIEWEVENLYGTMFNTYNNKKKIYHEKENHMKTVIYNFFLRCIKYGDNATITYDDYFKRYSDVKDTEDDTKDDRKELEEKRLTYAGRYSPGFKGMANYLRSLFEKTYYRKFFGTLSKIRNESCGICLEVPDIMRSVIFIQCQHSVCFDCFSGIVSEENRPTLEKIKKVTSEEIKIHTNPKIDHYSLIGSYKCPFCRASLNALKFVNRTHCFDEIDSIYSNLIKTAPVGCFDDIGSVIEDENLSIVDIAPS